jgi:uncharacterized metal-binding protein
VNGSCTSLSALRRDMACVLVYMCSGASSTALYAMRLCTTGCLVRCGRSIGA